MQAADVVDARQVRNPAPRLTVHRDAHRLQAGAGTAVHDHDFAGREALVEP
jgi:hypothetical protein